MKRKILSISIAAYNVEHFIRQTLDSLIVSPNYMEKLEIIVVNDGSTDSTLQIVQEYASRYPDTVQVIDKKNGGYGSTINASLPVAAGKYYKLLDGDDWYDQEGLLGLISYLEGSEADLVVSPYFMIKDKTIPEAHHPEIPEKECGMESLQLNVGELFQMHGVTVKTETLRRFGHPIAEKCFYTDTEYLFYCLASSKTLARYNKEVYCYRLGQDGQSVSLRGIRKHFREMPVVADRICACYEECIPESRGTKSLVLSHAVGFSIYSVFNAYLLLEDAGKHRKELMAFDRELSRRYPAAYEAGMNSKVVKTMRLLRFWPYPLFCAYIRWKYSRS